MIFPPSNASTLKEASFAADPHERAFGAARTAYRTAYGRDVADIGGGDSIPFAAESARALPAAAVVVTSARADPGSRAHGTGESLSLADFEPACLAEALLPAELTRS